MKIKIDENKNYTNRHESIFQCLEARTKQNLFKSYKSNGNNVIMKLKNTALNVSKYGVFSGP